ncbi:MAG: 50S ribosomal protein L24 [Candidatus Poribacteria bacterium]|nr:50S ribosomal protein L24 [Candidatus Poribacteria bacterium]
MSKKKLHVKKDDLVKVLSGQDRGKQGVVLEVFPEKNRAIVEGIHFIKCHLRPNQMGQGGIVEREGTIHISNLKKIN